MHSPRMGQRDHSPGQSVAMEHRETPPWVVGANGFAALNGRHGIFVLPFQGEMRCCVDEPRAVLRSALGCDVKARWANPPTTN